MQNSLPEKGMLRHAQTMPAAYGAVSGDVIEPDGSKSRRNIAIVHEFVVLAVFGPPVILCTALGLNPDVAYFVGRWAFIALIIVPFLILLPVFHMKQGLRLKSTFFLLSVWLPAAIFALIGGFMRSKTFVVMSALNSRDCYSFAGKRELERIYEQTLDVLDICDSQGVDREDCKEYHDWNNKNGYDVGYLRALELRFPCAGFCHDAERIWGDNRGTEAPACSLFAAEWINGAYVQSSIVLWYAAFVILAAIPGYMSAEKILRDVGYEK